MTDDIKSLLDIGLNEQDKNGKTPLILATWRGDLDTVKFLLDSGADVNIVDNLGENVVHYAARQKNTEVLLTILNTSADKNLKSASGYKQTALFTPAMVGNIPILTILLENGVNPNIYDKGKFTPLQWAVQQGQVESIKVLLKYKADVNTKSSKGITPLISASIKGILESVSLLVDAGAEVDAMAKNGYTALMYGAYYGHVDIVKYLLSKGANKNILSTKDETALSIAQKKKFDEVVSILED